MAEEESFVILGSSPQTSLLSCVVEQAEIGDDALVSTSIEKALEPPQTMTDVSLLSAKDLCLNAISLETATSGNSKDLQQTPASVAASSSDVQCDSVRTETVITDKTAINAATGTDSSDSSLASKFILGSIDANVLKTSIYSQFPSLSMHACAEDVVKFQNILDEYLKMKDMLLKVNTNIRLLYDKTYRWNQTMQTMEAQYKNKTESFELQIAQLRNENLLLKREVDTKMEQMEACEKVRANEQEELVRSVSEKTAQIKNMAQQIQMLEQQQLASFEYVTKTQEERGDKPEYVSQLEHQRIVKDLERKTSVLLAEKLDLTDMQTQYIDEINCLKVNLTAAEELINQLRGDIALLKSKDDERTDQFSQYEEERDRMKEEFTLLRQQVEVYSKDFEQERIARQNLAGEKDQLLQDLRVLQRKNQELIAEKENQTSTNSGQHQPIASSFASSASSIRKLPKPSNNAAYRCPICSKGYDSLAGVQSHANMCIDASN